MGITWYYLINVSSSRAWRCSSHPGSVPEAQQRRSQLKFNWSAQPVEAQLALAELYRPILGGCALLRDDRPKHIWRSVLTCPNQSCQKWVGERPNEDYLVHLWALHWGGGHGPTNIFRKCQTWFVVPLCWRFLVMPLYPLLSVIVTLAYQQL